MNSISSIMREMIERRLSESTKLTAGEAQKIAKLAKKKAEQIRKIGGSLADTDATRLELLADAFLSRKLHVISSYMNSGETENREQAFEVVSAVIGKDRAAALSKGNY
jgi:hypothetical protein